MENDNDKKQNIFQNTLTQQAETRQVQKWPNLHKYKFVPNATQGLQNNLKQTNAGEQTSNKRMIIAAFDNQA